MNLTQPVDLSSNDSLDCGISKQFSQCLELIQEDVSFCSINFPLLFLHQPSVHANDLRIRDNSNSILLEFRILESRLDSNMLLMNSVRRPSWHDYKLR